MAKPGFIKLAAAIFYDMLLLGAVLMIATFIALPLNHGEAFGKQQILYPIYLLVVSFIFYGWFWTHGGQTLGLKAWKIKLLSDETRQALSWRQAFVRYLAAIVSWVCFGLGFLWILIDKNRRSWHDMISRTGLYLDNGQD